MKNIDLGIEISEKVKNTNIPSKIERYNLVCPKKVTKAKVYDPKLWWLSPINNESKKRGGF
jgi:hypothetical protein